MNAAKIGKVIRNAAAAVGLGMVSTAAMAGPAQTILMDPDGAGGVFGAEFVRTLDWAQGNILANDCLPSNSTTCTILFQARLATIGDENGVAVPFGSPGVEYTMVLKLAATSSVTGGGEDIAFTARVDPDFANEMLIYYDTSPDSSNLAGTGFTDGVLVLSGLPSISTMSFGVTTSLDVVALDAFGANNYPDVFTVQGTGSATFNVDIRPGTDTINADFFPGLASVSGPLTMDIATDTQANLNFKQVDPSGSFFDGTGNPGVTPDFGDELTDANPDVGGDQEGFLNDLVEDCNGRDAPMMNPCDLQLQADASSSFQATVPEPASLGLLGLALVGVAGLRRRRSS